MEARARNVQTMWWFGWPHTESEIRVAASKLADNIAICSCYSCGNPRRHHGFWSGYTRTMQERRAEMAERDQVEEFLTEGLDLGECDG